MNNQPFFHYYGDSVRVLFVLGGLIMIVSYPFFASFIHTSVVAYILGCITLAVFGGLMNPKQKWIMVLNTIIPIVAFVVFEYTAVQTYLNLSSTTGKTLVAFFWVNQILALIFFFAAYFSTKTLRGTFVPHKE